MTGSSRADDATTFRLVMRLFVRRLLDNDLISPHADRHESFAVLYALFVSLAVFATFFLSTNYLAAFIQLPGPAALSALSDRFLLIAASITVSALAALIVWDAMAVEPRDAAILGPLPISTRTIARAKLAAAIAFGTGLTVAVNAVPSVLYPLFLTLNIRGTSGTTIVYLIAAHAVTVMIAGLFGFFGIITLRGVVRIVAGEHVFAQLSSGVQSAMIVAVLTGLLLAPTVRNREVRQWVAGTTAPRWAARPVLWFLGANETLAGHRVNETPVVPPPRFAMIDFRLDGDRLARSIYRTLLPQFAGLAKWAWASSLLVTALALTTFLWTNRRLPERAAALRPRSRLIAWSRRNAERFTDRDPEAQAGFFFTLQTLRRSAPHRNVIAVAIAAGLTHALVVLAQRATAATLPLGAFAILNLSLIAMVAGVTYAITIPAAPTGHWAIRMAWLGDERRYLAGVKRGVTLLIAAVAVLLGPVNIVLLGVGIAVLHSFWAVLFATTVLDALWLTYRKLPFVCGYVPIENPKLVWPVTFAGTLTTTYGLAAMERAGSQTPFAAVALTASLIVISMVVRAIDRTRRRERRTVDFDGRPTAATQRLGLFEHIAAQE